MSRVSLSRRLQAIREAAGQIDPFAMRVHRLTPAQRMAYDRHRAESERIMREVEARDGLASAYAAMIDGALALPEMPHRLAHALGIVRPEPIPATATASELSERYSAMVGH